MTPATLPDEVAHVQRGGTCTERSTGFRTDGSTVTESRTVTALDDDRLPVAVADVRRADAMVDAPQPFGTTYLY